MSVIHFGSIKLVVMQTAIWMHDGETSMPFWFREYDGPRNAMRAALRCAQERSEIRDALSVVERSES